MSASDPQSVSDQLTSRDGYLPHDYLAIDTPEQVALQFSVAGVGSRFVAALVDNLIIVGFYIVAFFALVLIVAGAAATGSKAGAELDTASKWVLAIFIFLNFLLIWGYYALFEALWRGQTPGKRLMKLRVLKDSGRQITFFEALARNLLRFIDYLPGFYLVGVVTMLCNKRSKRLGDLVAGTIVVHEHIEEAPLVYQSKTTITAPTGFAANEPERLAPWARPAAELFPADAIARLGAQDLIVIETFFARLLDLPLDTRAAMARRIATQLTAKMAVPLPEGNPERALESIALQMRSGGNRGF
jgi:uncharacterized RDD family membrane protein YckC